MAKGLTYPVARTLVKGDTILAILMFHPYNDEKMGAWGAIAKECDEYMLTLFKTIKRELLKYKNDYQIVFPINRDFKEAVRFVKMLGLKKIGTDEQSNGVKLDIFEVVK